MPGSRDGFPRPSDSAQNGTVIPIEEFGTLVPNSVAAAAANGAALRLALLEAGSLGGGVLDSSQWGWYYVDWVDANAQPGAVGFGGAGRTYCHGLLPDDTLMGYNFGVVAQAFPFATQGTIFNRHFTNLDQTAGNARCGYVPGHRLSGNAGNQPTGGLGPTAGGASGDGSMVANGYDFTNCTDEVMIGGRIFNVRGTGSGTNGSTVAAGSDGVDVTTFAGAGTLNLASVASFSAVTATAPGITSVATDLGPARIRYTGKGATSLTGCTYVSGGGVGSIIHTGNRCGVVETWVLRCQGTGQAHLIAQNIIDGRDVSGVQQMTSTGIAAQTLTGACEIIANRLYALKVGNGIAANAGTGELLIAQNVGLLLGHNAYSVENTVNFTLSKNVSRTAGSDVNGGHGMVINGAGGASTNGIIDGNTVTGTLQQTFASNGRGLLVTAGGGTVTDVDIVGGNLLLNNDGYAGEFSVATQVNSIDPATLANAAGNNAGGGQWNFQLASSVNAIPGQLVQSSGAVSRGPAIGATGATTASPYPLRTFLRVTNGAGNITAVWVNGLQVLNAAVSIAAAGKIFTIPVPMESVGNGGSWRWDGTVAPAAVDAVVVP